MRTRTARPSTKREPHASYTARAARNPSSAAVAPTRTVSVPA
jgi:hypothetical protein